MIGIILAGGRATRLGGGDKGLHRVGGVPILELVVATLRPHCAPLVVSANGAADRFTSLGLPVVADDVPDRPGPLAGILAGLDWAATQAPDASHAVTVPTDTPFLPADLVTRLTAARDAAMPGPAIVCARSGGAMHYVVALWRVDLRHDLRRALCVEGIRKVARFFDRHAVACVDWPVAPFDPFLNVNTEVDLRTADTLASGVAEARGTPRAL